MSSIRYYWRHRRYWREVLADGVEQLWETYRRLRDC